MARDALARVNNTCYYGVGEGGVASVKAYSSREVIRILRHDGWYLDYVRGDQYFFRHPTKPEKITVPHPVSSLKPKTTLSIFRQAGLDLEV